MEISNNTRATIIFVLHIFVIVAVGRYVWNLSQESTEQNYAEEIVFPRSVTQFQRADLVIQAKLNEPKVQNRKSRFERFEKLRTKALLNEQELAEKQRLLADSKTVQWVESELSKNFDGNSLALKERLSMIDILEDCVTWQENPIRNEVFSSMEKIILTKNYDSSSEEGNRQAIGDKVELLTILIEQEPSRARLLLDKIKDSEIERIANFTIKRLALDKKIGG